MPSNWSAVEHSSFLMHTLVPFGLALVPSYDHSGMSMVVRQRVSRTTRSKEREQAQHVRRIPALSSSYNKTVSMYHQVESLY